MVVGVTIISTTLFFTLLVAIVYFSKQRIKNKENKIYAGLIVLSIINLILELCCSYYICNINNSNLFYMYAEIFNRLFLIGLLTWLTLFTIYMIYISFILKNKINFKNKKMHAKLLKLVYIVLIILVIVLPIKYFYNGNYVYSYGAATNLVTIMGSISIIVDIICLFKNLSEIKNKKNAPLFILIFVMIIAAVLRQINPGIIIINSLFSFITVLMYFTIENPDMKLIQQLELAKNTADKANMAKSDFLSSMSHEIRTPLNAIVGFSECIEEDTTLDQAKSDAKDIVMASQNLLEIVNGVLDISKIEANKMEIVNASYNPKEVFNDLVKLVSTRIGDKDIKFESSVAQDLPMNLIGDSGKVKEVITNLLTNAVKYTEKGQIKFNVNCINEKNTCKLVISISDTGRGIKPDKIDTLFTKFNRLEEDKNTSIEGTGLGLAITKSLVEMMNGKIIVQSKYGIGSTFTVYLSQQINNVVEMPKENQSKEVIEYVNKTVLLVDDNSMNLKIGTRLLEKYKLNVTQVTSGFECIEELNKTTYDIVMLDDMMPKMSGIETLKKIKEIGKYKNSIIALTANATNGMREKYLKVGFNDYLSKPINKLELEHILNKYLNSNIKKENIEACEETYMEDKVKNVEYLKENGIDVESGIDLLGDIGVYNETLNDFLIESKTRMPKIEEYKLNNDMKNYAILVHALKGDSKYLGFEKLASLAYDHQLKSLENDIDYINKNYSQLIDETNRIMDIVLNYLNN